MWAREWFERARAVISRAVEAKERSERIRSALEGKAVRYDALPGGGGGDLALALIEAEAQADEAERDAAAWLDAATGLLFGDGGAARALGEVPAYAVQLHYLDAQSYREAALALKCSKAWAVAQASKCLRWLDLNRTRPDVGGKNRTDA